MNKRRPYNSLIERKLEQLPGADADHLWNGMHEILDKKMPQKKERHRFFFWIFDSSGLLALSLCFIFISGVSIFLLSTKHNEVVAIENTKDNPQPDKFSKAQKNISSSTQDITSAISSSSNNEFSINRSSFKIFDRTSFNNIIAPKTVRDSKEFVQDHGTNNLLAESFQNFNNNRSGSLFDPIYFTNNYNDPLLSSDNNKQIDSLIKQEELLKKNNQSNPFVNNEKGFYAGFMTGVDMSSIHFKSIRTGSSKGILLGYALNKKWSVESGLFWDTKRVYDDGSFFNPPGNNSATGITITDVNGKSRIYEVPVNIKYTIIQGKGKLFTTAGLSSYFMRSENYDYEYTINNQPGGHNYLNYKNATKNLFSVANLSLGYTQKVGAAGSIRIESYLKLPLNNIGVGKMPIMSTGLNVGFIKKLR